MMKTAMLRRACWIGLAILTGLTGCTHNYYYGATPGCPPISQPITTQMGQVCEVPGGTVVTSSTSPGVASQVGTNAQVVTNSTPQRVVISQPSYNQPYRNRFPWRHPDPESLATTRSDGALNETPINR